MKKVRRKRFEESSLPLASIFPKPCRLELFVCHSLVLSEAEVIRKNRGVGRFLPFWLAMSNEKGSPEGTCAEGNSNEQLARHYETPSHG